MKRLGLNMEGLKNINRSSILRYIQEHGQVSRKDVAQATGLTAASVTQLCKELIDEGILMETGVEENSNSVGRKKVFIDLNYEFCNVAVFNIEQRESQVTICDLKGDVSFFKVFPTDCEKSPAIFLEEMCDCVKNYEKFNSIKSCVVTIPGIVNKETGESINSYGIWNRTVDLRTMIESELNLPVLVENNVNAFAMAELLFGKGKEHANFLLVKWGPGVGSAFIIENKIYEGYNGKALEIGHMIVNVSRNTKKCNCGRKGCLESEISYSALADKYFINSYDLSGDEKKYRNEIKLFAQCLVNVMTVLEPDKVILCGPFFRSEAIRKLFIKECHLFDNRYNCERIIFTELSDREKYIGAVAVYLNEIIG